MSRQSIIDACRELNAKGINQGTSGNISVRDGDAMLITPSGVPYEDMTPEMIVSVPLDGAPNDGLKPSTEWHFHQAIYNVRSDAQSVVHAHPPNATAISIQRRGIPACHYMVAAFGGNDIPITGYARFGTQALSDMVARALSDRSGCLMANHGATVVGPSLPKAVWLMEELETLAQQYLLAHVGGSPVLLSDAEISEALKAFASYGKRD